MYIYVLIIYMYIRHTYIYITQGQRRRRRHPRRFLSPPREHLKLTPAPCTVASPAAQSQNLLGQKYTRVSIYTYILCTYYLYVYTVYNILPTHNYIYTYGRALHRFRRRGVCIQLIM